MKDIDIILIFLTIGSLIFLGGIFFNSTWMFLLGFICLCCTHMADYYKTMYEYDSGDSDSDVK